MVSIDGKGQLSQKFNYSAGEPIAETNVQHNM